MGGDGSGRWRSEQRKMTVDESLTLDLDYLQREGLLTPGVSQSFVWHLGSKYAASISYHVEREHKMLVLNYSVSAKRVTENIRTEIPLLYTPAYFGGVRYWLTCPLDKTGRKLSILYLPPGKKYFGCRQCHNLTYMSCQDSPPFGRDYRARTRHPGQHLYFRGVLAKAS